MSTKVKLVSLISAFVFVLAIMMVAAMAVPTVTLNMGGSISFTATDLQVTISQGVLANGTVDDSDNKMQEVKIDAYDDGAEELATWLNLNLTFNESGEDMTITFTITNNSKVDDIRATVTVDQGTTDNATVSVTTPSSSSVRIPANDGSQQFVVTFHIDNRNDSASIENFEINIDLEKYEPQVYDYFTFRVNSDDTTVTLTSFNEDLADTTDIVIPESVSQNESGQWTEGDDYMVTDILSVNLSSNGIFNNSGITSIELPLTLETIGSYAFYNCDALTEIDLSNCTSLTSIGPSAFQGCSGLTGDLVIPEGVTIINRNAFQECNFNGTLSLPFTLQSIGSFAFYSCGFTGSLEIPEGVTSIGDSAFSDCDFSSLEISEGVTSIGDSAFYSCSNLTGTLTLPTTLQSIGPSAFRDCSGLTGDLVIPEGVKSIGYMAFYSCSNLTGTLTLPSTIHSIDFRAFDGCRLAGSLEIPEDLTSIGDRAFATSNFDSITVDENNNAYYSVDNCLIDLVSKTLIKGCINSIIPSDGSIISIGAYAFYSCGLTGPLVLPEGVTSIGHDAFNGCSGLTGTLDLSNCTSLTSIGSSAFYGCSGLTGTLDLSNCTSLTSIGDYAFRYCSGLTGELVIPEGVTSIGDAAFQSCSGLTSIDLPSSLTSIGSAAFHGCSGLTSVTINQYVFENVTSSSSSCGYLLNNIGSGETVLVPTNLIDDLGLTNSYLDDTSMFTRSATAVDGYYVYTKI